MSPNNVESRLVSLERSNKRLRIATISLMGMIGVSLLAGAGGKTTTLDSLTVNQLWVKERCTVGDEYISPTDGRAIEYRTAVDLLVNSFRNEAGAMQRAAYVVVQSKTGKNMHLSSGSTGNRPEILVFDSEGGKVEFLYPQWVKKP